MAEEEPAPPLPWTALAGMMLAASLAPLGSTMIAVALPSIGDAFHTKADLTPWLVASYLIASIALQSPGGRIGDLIGHGRALGIGLVLVAAGSVLGTVSGRLELLAAARVLMAAGGAAAVPACMALLRNHTGPDRRARVFGFFGAGMGLAAAAGPLVGGELTARLGWRAIFAANLPVVALSMLLIFASRGVLKGRVARGPRPRFDWLGSALLGAGLTLVIVALRVKDGGAPVLGAAGAALLVVFPFWERRAASPLIDLDLFRRRAFSAGGSIVGLQNMAMYPILFQLPVFFEKIRGLGPKAMGRTLLGMTLAMMLASTVAGRLSERIGARLQVLLASLLALGGLWWLRDFASIREPVQILPGLILLGAGIGLSSPPAQAASMSAVTRETSGMAGGVLSTMRYLGGVAGTAAMGALLTDATSVPAHQAPVIVYAGALAASALLALFLPRERRPAGNP